MPRTVRVKVAAIDGRCDVHQVGDVFYIRGAKLDAKGPVCIHALPSILQFGLALREGADPVEMGTARAGTVARVACPDPGPPLTEGGMAIFELELMGERRQRTAQHRYVEG
ncbi:MAG: TIGR04076 family protein [Thermoplasmata archaeon]|nr:TIGR04076 family protein [Thermoplasmata archaeon]